ncbi:MAG: hypothetical protein WBQ59_11430 [Candidatus Acidiferrum sp.]
MRTPDSYSVAGASDERGLLLEEETIQRKRTSSVREALVGTLGQSPPARVVHSAQTDRLHIRITQHKAVAEFRRMHREGASAAGTELKLVAWGPGPLPAAQPGFRTELKSAYP